MNQITTMSGVDLSAHDGTKPAAEWMQSVVPDLNIRTLRAMVRQVGSECPPTGSTREVWLGKVVDSLLMIEVESS